MQRFNVYGNLQLPAERVDPPSSRVSIFGLKNDAGYFVEMLEKHANFSNISGSLLLRPSRHPEFGG